MNSWQHDFPDGLLQRLDKGALIVLALFAV
jgi:hypothetical protein